MDLASMTKLISGEGWGLLQSLPPYDESTVLSLGEGLRAAGFDTDLVAAALTQSRLRAKGREKFGEFADGMLFTADGLEQATRLEIAARHAQRFRGAGVRQVFDLTCGIGSDAMAIAGLDMAVTAIEADEVTATVAGVNLRHWPGASAFIGTAEGTQLPAGEGARHAGAWLDPARRTPGVTDARGKTRRVFRLDAISPSWSTVQSIAQSLPATGAKLSPSFPHAAIPAGTEAQWTSLGGEVLECAIWWGPLVSRAGRSALVIGSQGKSWTVREADTENGINNKDDKGGKGGGAAPVASSLGQIGSWLYEPDRAVIRAGLTGALTSAVDGFELDSGVGYVTSERCVDVGYARRFAVTESMPLNVKALRAWLRDRDVGRVTIKKRGVVLNADELRRQLRLSGSVEMTLVLTRVKNQQVCLVVRPV
ncbi:MAG: class I SAM-dependent methyltransferase [Dermatophilaceae bacterium]|nr:class I SAM-dependent methyltransferase [Dermatophilaceae bacterium]